MPGRAEKSDEIRLSHVNGQPCCLHGCIKAFMETVGWEIVKKEKKNSEASVMTHFQCAAACWENLVEESRDRSRWNRRRGQTDVLSQMASLVPKGHCTHCFYSNLSQMNFLLQTVFKGKQRLFKRSLTKYETSNAREYQLWNRSLFFPPYLPIAARRICTRRAASAE